MAASMITCFICKEKPVKKLVGRGEKIFCSNHCATQFALTYFYEVMSCHFCMETREWEEIAENECHYCLLFRSSGNSTPSTYKWIKEEKIRDGSQREWELFYNNSNLCLFERAYQGKTMGALGNSLFGKGLLFMAKEGTQICFEYGDSWTFSKDTGWQESN